MAISIRNIEKFFDDHLELSDRREEVLERAHKGAEGNYISVGSVPLFMEDLTEMFFNDFDKNSEHHKIVIEDLGAPA